MQSSESVLSACERLAGGPVTIRTMGERVLALISTGSHVTAAYGWTAEEALTELHKTLDGGLQVAASPHNAAGEIGMWH